MASPVTPLDFKALVSDPSATLCGNFKNTLLKLPVLIYRFFNWAFNSDGTFSAEFLQSVVPAGSYLFSASVSTPSGYLLCNGQLVSRTTYAALFTAIGTTYGVGDGTTTFGLPNFQDRFPIGSSGTKATASVGGADTVTLDLTNSPPHQHFLVASVTVDTTEDPLDAVSQIARKKASGADGDYSLKRTDVAATLGLSDKVGGSAGVAVPHANIPPYLTCSVFIKI